MRRFQGHKSTNKKGLSISEKTFLKFLSMIIECGSNEPVIQILG